jgi:HEAT repeat protein
MMMTEGRTGSLKEEIAGYLEREDYEGLGGLKKGKGLIARTLISMSYDKEDPLSWRAIDAIGRLVSRMEPDKARTFAQRVLWMMREESGNNAWTGSEILGEIVRRSPERNEDLALIVISFHEELIFRAGSLRALARIAEVRPDLAEAFRKVPAQYLRDPDPSVRGYAVVALMALGSQEHKGALEGALGDKGEFLYYEKGRLQSVVIGELAGKALGKT